MRPHAPDAPAVQAGNLVFAAGQIASDDRSGVAAEARIDPAFPYYGSSIKRQTRYILQKLGAKFEAAGTSLEHAVKAHVFHTDLRNFDAFDEAWREFFPDRPPCRATVGMAGDAGARLPRSDRPDRHRSLDPGQGLHLDRAARAGQLFGGDGSRRFRFRGRADGERLQDRRAGGGQDRSGVSVSTVPTSSGRPATSSNNFATTFSRPPAPRSTTWSRPTSI